MLLEKTRIAVGRLLSLAQKSFSIWHKNYDTSLYSYTTLYDEMHETNGKKLVEWFGSSY